MSHLHYVPKAKLTYNTRVVDVIRPAIALDKRETIISEQAIGIAAVSGGYKLSLHLCDVIDAIDIVPEESTLRLHILPEEIRHERAKPSAIRQRFKHFSLGYGYNASITLDFMLDNEAYIHSVHLQRSRTNTITLVNPQHRALVNDDLLRRGFVFVGDQPDSFLESDIAAPVSAVRLEDIPDYAAHWSTLLCAATKTNDPRDGMKRVIRAASGAAGRMMRELHVGGPWGYHDGKTIRHSRSYRDELYAPISAQVRKPIHRAVLYQIFAKLDGYRELTRDEVNLLCKGQNTGKNEVLAYVA